jgi:tRNA (guanine-N7-)-methyltransferase
LDLACEFGRNAPRVLDVGFGDGEALITAAANYPDIDYLGVEVHEPGIGHLLVLLERAQLGNVRVIARDVVDVIADMLAPSSFDAVNLFFPDPWPKKRHHKRRLIQPAFVESVAVILKPHGLFHVATDWASYADHAVAVIEGSSRFELIDETRAPGETPARVDEALGFRAPTKFERRGRRLGHEVVDLVYRCTADNAPSGSAGDG